MNFLSHILDRFLLLSRTRMNFVRIFIIVVSQEVISDRNDLFFFILDSELVLELQQHEQGIQLNLNVDILVNVHKKPQGWESWMQRFQTDIKCDIYVELFDDGPFDLRVVVFEQ